MSLAEVAGGGVAGNAVVAVSTLLFLTWALLPSTSERALAGGWSIESEMTHYILFPLFRKFEISGLFTVLAISGFLAWLSDLASDHLQTLSPLTIRLEALSIFTTFPFFVIGMILGKSQGATLRASFNAALMYLRTNKIMGFFLMLGLILLSANELPYGNVAEASVFCLAMFLLSFPILRSAKATQFLVWVGKYSYFTYFFHFWIISGIIYALELQNSRNISSLLIEIWWTLPLLNILLFCFVVLICQVIGAVSFRYFEAPWIRKSRKA